MPIFEQFLFEHFVFSDTLRGNILVRKSSRHLELLAYLKHDKVYKKNLKKLESRSYFLTGNPLEIAFFKSKAKKGHNVKSH